MARKKGDKALPMEKIQKVKQLLTRNPDDKPMSVRKIAAALGLKRAAVGSIRKRVMAGLPLGRKEGSGGRPKLDRDATAHLESLARRNPSKSAAWLATACSTETGIRVSQCTVLRALRTLGIGLALCAPAPPPAPPTPLSPATTSR
jgi:hypothetical protein